MDVRSEVLVPLLIAAAYLFSGIFRGKEEQETRSAEEEGETLSDRERRVQEEIRRKIRERRQGPPPAAETPAERGTPPSYDPNVPERPRRGEVRRPERPRVKEIREERRVVTEPERERRPREEPPVSPFEGAGAGGGGMMDEIQRRQKEIDDIQRRAAELKQQAARQIKKARGGPGGRERKSAAGRAYRPERHRAPASLRESVIEGLRDPEEFKRAILSYEILGTPVGERREGKIGPFWEQ